jgi:hypothetical protein
MNSKNRNNMKKKLYLVFVMFAALTVMFNSCNKSELEELYPNPGTTSSATVEQFFTGFLTQANEVVLPWYWRFFVVEQPTLGHYTQTMGWMNANDQYLVPTAATDWRWNLYYNGMMTHFRALEGLYADLSEEAQAELKVYMLAAKVFFYDQTQQVVDLYGDIPWSEAGMVRELGDLDAALPKYDDAKAIYETMIADLKTISDELGGLTLDSYTAQIFAQKDYLNHGNLLQWRKYANSLRLRMLMRMSGVSDVAGAVSEIFGNTSQYPIIENNAENVMLTGNDALQATTSSGSGGIRSAMETWGQYDIAPKAVCDFMVDNGDPRLEIMFDPNIEGVYAGMDPLMNSSDQNSRLSDGLIARYDTSTFTRNNFFPGFVIGAAEVSFIKAEAIQKGFVGGDAKAAYNMGVEQSIEFYFGINATGTYRDPIAMDAAAVAAYLNAPAVSWDANGDKMNLIATQKWLNSGLGAMPQTWAELRRLDLPVLEFMPDNATASGQTLPPLRWLYPNSEKSLNSANYETVIAKDKLNQKIFWDAN